MLFAEAHNLYKAKRALCKVSSMFCVGQTVAPVERVSLVRQRCHLHGLGCLLSPAVTFHPYSSIILILCEQIYVS